MLHLERILVPIDFSKSAALAHDQARLIAERFDAELHVLHVTRHPTVTQFFQRDAPESAEREHVVYASEWMGLPIENPPSQTPGDAIQKGSRQSIRTIREAPSVTEGILTYVTKNDIDLIIMGTHGRTGLRRWVLGSTAEEVVRRASCPVLTIRHGDVRLPTEPPRRILVPVDFSEPTRSLIGHAREMAAVNEAEVDLLHVIEEPSSLRFFKVDGFRALLPKLAHRARDHLKKMAEETAGPDVSLRYNILTGTPGREIVRFAEAQSASGIMMGTHGHSGLRRLAVGSVAERVMRTAPCPVFALKAFGDSLVRVSEEEPERHRATETNRQIGHSK